MGRGGGGVGGWEKGEQGEKEGGMERWSGGSKWGGGGWISERERERPDADKKKK